MKRTVPCLTLALLALATLRLAADDAGAGPRLGKYRILSYGAPSAPPLYLGYFVLSDGGVYKAYLPGDKLSTEGRYEYDAGKKAVIWKTGQYAKDFGGDFTIERDGKTHKIRLKRTTVATNSTDAVK